MYRLLSILLVFAAGPGVAQQAPSGLTLQLQEVRFEAEEEVLRLRFVAPELRDLDRFGFARIEGDFQHLCDTVGLKTWDEQGRGARSIIVSLASEPVALGEAAPEVVQYFDQFRIAGDLCQWEGL